jgi:hypothetical protein
MLALAALLALVCQAISGNTRTDVAIGNLTVA